MINSLPLPSFGRDGEPAAMAVHDMLDDGEAEPRAAARPALLHVDAVEAFGEARNMFVGDAGPMVAHRSARRSCPACGTRCRRACRSFAYLMAFSTRFCTTCTSSSQSPRTGRGPSLVTFSSHAELPAPCPRAVSRTWRATCVRSTFAEGPHVLVHLDPRQREQVVDQALHAVGLAAHETEESHLRLLVVAWRHPGWFR